MEVENVPIDKVEELLAGENSENYHGTSENNYIPPQRRWKNSRRLRNGHGRGSEVNDTNVELKEVVAEQTPEEFFKTMEKLILEYFENGDTRKVAVSLDEVTCGSLRTLVTTYAVQIALDHKDSQREMISVLISDLFGSVVFSRDIVKGYDMLLKNLPELMLRTLDAPVLLGNFIARSVADDCIPLEYATKPDNVEQLNEYALDALKSAVASISLKEGLAHLDNIWGSAGPLRPVQNITNQMTSLLEEYLKSGDFDKTANRLRALEVPHYHHEFVYETIFMALCSILRKTRESMCTLLNGMDTACLVSPAQMEQGFQRVFDDIPDFFLDIEKIYKDHIYDMLDLFVERCSRAGMILDKIIRNMPSIDDMPTASRSESNEKIIAIPNTSENNGSANNFILSILEFAKEKQCGIILGKIYSSEVMAIWQRVTKKVIELLQNVFRIALSSIFHCSEQTSRDKKRTQAFCI